MIESSGPWFDWRGLARSLALLLGSLAPIGAITAAVCAVLWWLAPPRPDGAVSVDHYVVAAQLERVSTVPRPDLAFFGDSSCLMGVHVPTLRRLIPGTSIESFCAIGYLGPAGYAAMIRRMHERGALPEKIVIVLHPVQFPRHPSWEPWVEVAERGSFAASAEGGFPFAVLDGLRARLARVLYIPLPGNYGFYYGSRTAFIRDIHQSHGSAVDPGLTLAPSPDSDYPFETNASFEAALAVLADALGAVSSDRVYLLLSAIPDARLRTSRGRQDRSETADRIARLLGIPQRNVLSTPASLPGGLFSTETHLHRFGRVSFSETLAEVLRPVLAR